MSESMCKNCAPLRVHENEYPSGCIYRDYHVYDEFCVSKKEEIQSIQFTTISQCYDGQRKYNKYE